MLKFGTYFLYVFFIYNQYGMAESQENRDSVGVLKDPESQRPLYEKFFRRQQEIDYINFFLNTKLEAIQKETLEKLDEMKRETLVILRANTDRIQKDGRCVVSDAPNQCGAFCLAAQRPLFDHNRKVQQQLNALSAKLNETLTKVGSVRKESEENVDTIDSQNKNELDIPPGFKKMRNRYYYIDHVKRNWTEAREACHKRGGYLAVFQNYEELYSILENLTNQYYWLGISKSNKNGEYVSDATGKPAEFLHFHPINTNIPKIPTCVAISYVRWFEGLCSDRFFSICQWDDTI
ncbi:uncharacterized protein LOC119547111 [Drosophila subpulchrella]|uniref:uncharacterized protein LOC119547111 n=1 Tax=Drosophila subpulchrella TaxID=1486046 RepID=UPI0018A1A9E0|nr:uncharacterized protein LOC119547111 [Drosophila subpulchrella]